MAKYSCKGANLFNAEYQRDYVIGVRDRCDFTIDRIRTVRTEGFRYIRNFLTDRPYMQSQYRPKSYEFGYGKSIWSYTWSFSSFNVITLYSAK
ncbi:MAG: hypothetical protein ACN4GF_11525 [Lentimonas sp.]